MGDKALRGNKLTAGRTGFGLGSAVKAATKLGMKIVKGKKNPLRMDQAQRLKDYHRKIKSKKRTAGRIEEGKSKAFQEKYIKPMSPETKVKWSRSQHPKSWRRAGKSVGGFLKGAKEVAKKVFKKKPKPSKANKWEGESKFDWIDRMDAEEAIAAGEKPPFKIGKTAKNIIKGAVALPVGAAGASYAHGKWKKHLKKKKKDKD